MTEEEWLACEDPEQMLRFIKQNRTMRRPTKQRKQKLFSVACCRRIWSLFSNERSRDIIEVVERSADNQATNEERQAALADANTIWRADAANDAAFACLQLFWKEGNGVMCVSTSTIGAAFKHQQAEANKSFDPFAARMRGACPSEERAQCALIRDIFGNPFRSVSFSSGLRTDTAVSLARQMYDSRDFGAMPILADALQDAGCDEAAILDHCRGPGPHVRGCWVVDLVLGKE